MFDLVGRPVPAGEPRPDIGTLLNRPPRCRSWRGPHGAGSPPGPQN